MNDDKPNLDNAKAIEAEREHDDVKVGDVIQQWTHVQNPKHRVSWVWRDGTVLALVPNPCKNVRWVALVQWHDGDVVKYWTALPQHQWVSVQLRRKPDAS